MDSNRNRWAADNYYLELLEIKILGRAVVRVAKERMTLVGGMQKGQCFSKMRKSLDCM